MPLQNRVTPFGEFEAIPARGLLMGNRGILHDDHGALRQARWRHKNWVACALSFKNRRRAIMSPGRYTELFFCDEAVALAAGHRPCKECRRDDFNKFAEAWRRTYGLLSPPRAGEIDQELHRTRVTRDRKAVRVAARVADLPQGTFVSLPDQPYTACLVWNDGLYRWAHGGYVERLSRSGGALVIVLTPEPTVRVLASGYLPLVHPTAQ
jgi:hypothetical protein